MKKLFVMLLATVLLLCGAAMAEEAFTFRDGLQWGMSPDEVQAVEGEFDDLYDYSDTEDIALIYEGQYGDLTTELRYMFVNGRFCAFAVNTTVLYDYAALSQTLTDAYGEPVDAAPYLVDKFVSNSEVEVIKGWQPAADAYIALIGMDGAAFGLYYFDPSVDFWAAENDLEPETAPEETGSAPVDVPAAPAGTFTFRGLTWGMTPDEVQAVEGKFDLMESASYTLSGGLLEEARVSKFDAEMTYYFIENGLAGTGITVYTSDDGWEADANYLVQALTILYGEPRDTAAMPDSLYQLFFASDDADELYVWLPAEDTCIFLMCDEWWEEVAIGYFNHTHDWLYHMQTTAPVTIDTTGL